LQRERTRALDRTERPRHGANLRTLDERLLLGGERPGENHFEGVRQPGILAPYLEQRIEKRPGRAT